MVNLKCLLEFGRSQFDICGYEKVLSHFPNFEENNSLCHARAGNRFICSGEEEYFSFCNDTINLFYGLLSYTFDYKIEGWPIDPGDKYIPLFTRYGYLLGFMDYIKEKQDKKLDISTVKFALSRILHVRGKHFTSVIEHAPKTKEFFGVSGKSPEGEDIDISPLTIELFERRFKKDFPGLLRE